MGTHNKKKKENWLLLISFVYDEAEYSRYSMVYAQFQFVVEMVCIGVMNKYVLRREERICRPHQRSEWYIQSIYGDTRPSSNRSHTHICISICVRRQVLCVCLWVWVLCRFFIFLLLLLHIHRLYFVHFIYEHKCCCVSLFDCRCLLSFGVSLFSLPVCGMQRVGSPAATAAAAEEEEAHIWNMWMNECVYGVVCMTTHRMGWLVSHTHTHTTVPRPHVYESVCVHKSFLHYQIGRWFKFYNIVTSQFRENKTADINIF